MEDIFSEVRNFFWYFCGDDKQIIALCNESLKNRFAFIGVLVCLIFSLCYISGWICLDMLFSSIWLNIPLSFFFAWMITNIYLVVLTTFSRQVMPVKYSDVIKHLSDILRTGFILLFAVYTAKLIESGVLHFLASTQGVPLIRGGIILSDNFDERLRLLSYTFPYSLSWIFTGLVIYLFMLPVLLKKKVLPDSEFYSLKTIVERSLVEETYTSFKLKYVEYLKAYDPLISYFENYIDPPFNTEKIIDDREFTEHDELFDLYNS